MQNLTFRLFFLSAVVALGQTIPSVPTYHNDNFRSGVNQDENQLTLGNVAPGSFGKLFSNPVDGAVYAQPLYVPGLNVASRIHNVVFIATENNTLYAFDADIPGPPLWTVNFNYGAPGATVTPVPAADLQCSDLTPIVGITSTPVIDLETNTLYTVAKTKEVSGAVTKYYQHLHGINLLTGTEAFPQVEIKASVPGSCGNVQNGNVVYDPLIQHQRASLLLLNHVIYIGSASHCDVGSYNGWLLGYDTRTLAQVSVFNTTPDDITGQCKGGIWQSGGGPAADVLGNLYVLTGNGGFNASSGGRSYSESLLKMQPSTSPEWNGIAVTDYFTPFDQDTLTQGDLDFAGSGTAVILDNQTGTHPHLMVASGKKGTIYLVDRDHLGGHSSSTDNVVQTLPRAIGDGGSAYPPPVYFQNKVYYAAGFDTLKSFQLTNGVFGTTPFATGPTSYKYLGAGLSISAAPDGSNAIVWGLENTGSPGVLHAYNAITLAELYNTNMATGGVDNPPSTVKFSIPTVVNGRVYAGTQNSVEVYGLLSASTNSTPFGSIDTPVNHATGLAGAISVTGWALSSAGVTTVALWREPVAGESFTDLVFVGNTTIVPGARPDVAKAYPGYPQNDSGWGLQVLTNELPNTTGQPGLGNGTYNFHVLVTTAASQTTDIGVLTVTVNNAGSVLPFGTIDTPAPGQTISGSAFVNFGWALTPQPGLIPVNGSTIGVYIDGVLVGHPVYNNFRTDIATIFPGLQNSGGAVGYYYIDTTKLANGLHTISWTVTDTLNHAQGIGSRYFTVQN